MEIETSENPSPVVNFVRNLLRICAIREVRPNQPQPHWAESSRGVAPCRVIIPEPAHALHRPRRLVRQKPALQQRSVAYICNLALKSGVSVLRFRVRHYLSPGAVLLGHVSKTRRNARLAHSHSPGTKHGLDGNLLMLVEPCLALHRATSSHLFISAFTLGGVRTLLGNRKGTEERSARCSGRASEEVHSAGSGATASRCSAPYALCLGSGGCIRTRRAVLCWRLPAWSLAGGPEGLGADVFGGGMRLSDRDPGSEFSRLRWLLHTCARFVAIAVEVGLPSTA